MRNRNFVMDPMVHVNIATSFDLLMKKFFFSFRIKNSHAEPVIIIPIKYLRTFSRSITGVEMVLYGNCYLYVY